MPDDLDYQHVADLLGRPETWTDEEAGTIRFLLRQSRDDLKTVHPLDRKRREEAETVIRDYEAALARYSI